MEQWTVRVTAKPGATDMRETFEEQARDREQANGLLRDCLLGNHDADRVWIFKWVDGQTTTVMNGEPAQPMREKLEGPQ
jgi:hypothetical protein